MTTSPTSAKVTRALSTTSSGERTVRGRRRSSATSHATQSQTIEAGASDDEDVMSASADSKEIVDPLTHPAWEQQPDSRLPPLWRHESDHPFTEGEDPEEGPSDYWRRPSPQLSPERPPIPMDSPWGTTAVDHTATPDGEVEGHADAAAYEKRLQEVLALTQTPTPSPTKRKHNGKMFELQQTYDTDGDAWDDYHPLNSGGYEEAVRNVLGDGDARGDEGGEEEFGDLQSGYQDDASDRTPSTLSASVSGLDRHPVRASPGPSRSYIHPSISRLRSQQHPLRMSSSSTVATVNSLSAPNARLPSHFSQLSLSRSDSFSTMSGLGRTQSRQSAGKYDRVDGLSDQDPAFSFHALRHLSAHLFNRTRTNGEANTRPPPPSRKASSVLGFGGGRAEPSPTDPWENGYGVPSVMDVRGMIAVGTENGWVVVYTFGQELRCILGNESTAASGAVTAVTICDDQTFIGVGHANGNVYLYDLSNPSKPARTQLALSLRQVMSGRKEGHLQGSRVLHIGFVGKRHTSIVTGDEDGRAFWFSLGRVMGVDSNDAVRVLGSYPEREKDRLPEEPRSPLPDGQTTPSSVRSQTSKRATTLFSALPLSLGSSPHSTDQFHFAALLTPVKLVVVGMKPTAKTWFRKMRGDTGGPYGGFVGCSAWLRSGDVTPASGDRPASDPVLAYAWGTSLRFLRVRIAVGPAKDKKADPVKTPEFVEGRRWEAPHPIQSLHWFDSDHILLITTHQVVLLNVRSMRAVENTPLQTKLLTSHDFYSGLSLGKAPIEVIPPVIQASCATHRDKLFLLTRANVQVGSLQHWNDRVLANVHRGDFLGAINLALAYYEGRAPGNTINLPDQPQARREVIGARVRELMRASLDWAFSEERMKDDTHFSADGRGVDLTSLFEGLAIACIDACIAMSDTDFLFDEAFEHFSNAGIQGIFLERLEGYVFDGRVGEMPPNVVQALIAMHEEREEYALAESVIWHVAPSSLDINQAVTLCEKRGLWDALIHVYTRAMGDYIAPIVKLIRVVCDVQRNRRARPSLVGDYFDDEERLAPDAYKLYAYVTHVLSGLWYPSGESMNEQQATQARSAVYELLFSDHNVYWPEGSFDLVLTEQDNGNGEPPYPYLRLLLRFDTEAFLHAMDIAFEDSYLNDSGRAINRQSIINLMLDVMDEDFHSSDVTFLHIFVARNLPKYPQFIFIPPSTSHRILVSLAADPDQSTREDRQLAAEYLLSAYTPHDGDDMLERFRQAGFFRILRASYRRERKWGALIDTLLKDPEADESVFTSLDEVIATAKSAGGVLPTEVTRAVSDALPQLFDVSVRQTARLLDRSLPSLHDTAIANLEDSEHKQAAYLRCLLDPSADDVESDSGEPELGHSVLPSTHLHIPARHKYVSLLARHDPSAVVPFLDARGAEFFDLGTLAEQCEEANLPEGQLWALDRAGKRKEVFETVDSVLASRGADLAHGLTAASEGDVHIALSTLAGVTHMAIRLCREHSSESDGVEDMWFGVLHSITELVHSISALAHTSDMSVNALDSLRGYVQDTLQALLTTQSPGLSFARLFKRLVEAGPQKGKATGRAYSEFRAILSGMLDSFRADTELIALSIRLVEADAFDLLEEKVELSARGWRPTSDCVVCRRPIKEKFLVRADGAVHPSC